MREKERKKRSIPTVSRQETRAFHKEKKRPCAPRQRKEKRTRPEAAENDNKQGSIICRLPHMTTAVLSSFMTREMLNTSYSSSGIVLRRLGSAAISSVRALQVYLITSIPRHFGISTAMRFTRWMRTYPDWKVVGTVIVQILATRRPQMTSHIYTVPSHPKTS